jgi:ADP-ribose pyrophosphatase YjhB (NUDIX family)
MISPQAHITEIKCCPLCGMPVQAKEIAGKVRLACTQCDFIHWNNPKPVTATVIPMDGGLVLVKRKEAPCIGDWCLPGGFIETFEHPAESAIREVEEETGLKVKINKLLLASTPNHNINVIVLFYLAHPASGVLTPGDDASEVRIFKQHELPVNIAFDLHKEFAHLFFKHNGNFSSTVLDALISK